MHAGAGEHQQHMHWLANINNAQSFANIN